MSESSTAFQGVFHIEIFRARKRAEKFIKEGQGGGDLIRITDSFELVVEIGVTIYRC